MGATLHHKLQEQTRCYEEASQLAESGKTDLEKSQESIAQLELDLEKAIGRGGKLEENLLQSKEAMHLAEAKLETAHKANAQLELELENSTAKNTDEESLTTGKNDTVSMA